MAEQEEQGVSARARVGLASDLTDQQERYLRGVEKTGTLTAGCKTGRVSPHTVYRWRDDADFAEAERIAQESFADGLEQEAVRRAWHGVKSHIPIYHKGEAVGEIIKTEYSDTLMVMMLKAIRPDKYRERRELQHTGKDGERLGALSDDDINAQIAVFLGGPPQAPRAASGTPETEVSD